MDVVLKDLDTFCLNEEIPEMLRYLMGNAAERDRYVQDDIPIFSPICVNYSGNRVMYQIPAYNMKSR